MNEQPIKAEQVMENVCRHVLASLTVDDVRVLDDYDDIEEPHGFNHYSGGPAYCTLTRRMISAAARVTCHAPLPALPNGFRLVHGLRETGKAPNDDLLLFGPGIDDDAPERLAEVLTESYGQGLARSLHPAIEEYVDCEYLDDWRELQTRQSAWVHGFRVSIDNSGACIEFVAEVEDGE